MSSSSRPGTRMLPAPTPESAAFWQGGAQGSLVIHRCRSCRRLFHPPAPVCHRCRSTDVGPEAVSPRATVTTFSINRHTWYAGFEAPYVVAIVELDDEPDVRLTTNIVGCEPDEVCIGQSVEADFERWDDVWIPVFRPVPPADTDG